MNSFSFAPDLLEIFIKGMNEVFPADQQKSFASLEVDSEKQSISIDILLGEVENQFGQVSASGMFFRCGGAAFKHLVRRYGKQAKIDSLEFRLQPQQKRLMDGTLKIVKLLDKWNAAKFSLQKNDDLEEITATPIGLSGSLTGGRIWLHFIAGLFQEYLYWAGSGKQYPFQIIAPDYSRNEIIIQFRVVPVD